MHDMVKTVISGVLIIVFSSIIIAAGAIVWDGATGYQDDIDSAKREIMSIIEVFPRDMELLYNEIESNRKESNENFMKIMNDIKLIKSILNVEESVPTEAVVEKTNYLIEPDSSSEKTNQQSQEQYFEKNAILDRIRQSQQQQLQQTIINNK